MKRTAVISDIRDGGVKNGRYRNDDKGTANNGCQKISR